MSRKAKSDGAKALRKVNSLVKRLGKIEKKYFDQYATDASLVNVWEPQILSAVPEGVGPSERIGRSISGKMLHVSIGIANSSATSAKSLRIFVMRDNTGAGVTPTMSNVLQNGSTDIHAFQNFESGASENYEILYNKRFVLGVSTAPNAERMFDFKLPLRGNEVSFTGIGATDYGKGTIFIWFYNQNSTVSEVSYSVNSRLHYTDM